MALVSYSSSSSSEESEEDAKHVSKRRRRRSSNSAKADRNADLPPLPASFLDLYSSAARVSTRDDPSLHGGRKRAIPHVEGNWATHVYLEWHPTPAQSALLTTLLSTISARQHSPRPPLSTLLHDSLGVPLPLHISLSRPLVLRTESRRQFLSALTSALLSRGPKPGPGSDGDGRLRVRPEELGWHPNEHGTRAFLVLRVRSKGEANALSALLGACNGVAREFGLPALYTDYPGRRRSSSSAAAANAQPQKTKAEKDDADADEDYSRFFHVSLAWSLDVDDAAIDADSLRRDADVQAIMRKIREMEIDFSHVKIRIGKDVSTVPLNRRRTEEKGILG